MIIVELLKKKVGGIVKFKNVVERLVQIKGFFLVKKFCFEEYGCDCVLKDVKEGYVVVIVVDGYYEVIQRFVVLLMFLEYLMFRKFFEWVEEEYGFNYDGVFMVLCWLSYFWKILIE